MANLKLENEASEINERKRKLDSPSRRLPNSEEERCCEVLISNIPYEFHWQKLKDLIRQKIGEVGHVKIWQDDNGRPKGAGVAMFPNPELAQKAVDDLNRHDVNGRALVVKKFTEEEKRKRQRLEDKKESRAGGGSRGGDVGDRLGPRAPPEEETATRILEMVHTIQNSDPSVLRRLGVNENVIDAVQSGQLSDTVFIANIDYTMKWQELKDLFKMAGRVNNVKMVEDSDGKSKGYGTIVFATPLEALEAVANFHGQSVRDRRITVKIDQMSKNRVSIASLMSKYGPRHLPPPPVDLMSRPALGSGLSSLSGLGHGSISSSLLSRELELERLALQREREKILLSSLHSERGGGYGGPPPYNDDYGRVSSLPPRPSLEPNVDSLRDGPSFRGMHGPPPQLERDPSMDLRQKELDLLKELEMLRNRMGGSSGGGPQPGPASSAASSFAGGSSLQGSSSFGRDNLSHGGVSEPNPALAPGFGRSGNRGGGSCQIFIRNLPFQVNWQMLKDRFSEFGKVLYAEIKMENGKSKGCGIVKFSNSQEAESAIMRMNGKVIDGREIEVRFDSSGL